jgi:surfeit locus 1 family protein
MVMLPCLIGLGMWQLDRAQAKRALYDGYARQLDASVIDLNINALGEAEDLQWRKSRASGRYLGPNILLDNRVRNRQVGYEVYTPFQVDGGITFLVARGWIAAGSDRSQPPVINLPEGNQEILGHLGYPPWVGVGLKRANNIERLDSGLVRVQRIDLNSLHSVLKRKFSPYVVYLDGKIPHGYDRRWPLPSSGADKHIAYAVQWFAMAAVLLGLYLKINLKIFSEP